MDKFSAFKLGFLLKLSKVENRVRNILESDLSYPEKRRWNIKTAKIRLNKSGNRSWFSYGSSWFKK